MILELNLRMEAGQQGPDHVVRGLELSVSPTDFRGGERDLKLKLTTNSQ